MRCRAIWTTNLASLLIGASMFGVFASLPRFVQTSASTGYGFAQSVQESGRLPMLVMMAVAFGSLDAAGLPLETGYTVAFLVLSVLALGAAVVALGVRVPAYDLQRDRGTEHDGVTQPVSASALVA